MRRAARDRTASPAVPTARSTSRRSPAATSGASTKETGGATVLQPPTAGQGARRVWCDSKSRVWVSEWNAGQLARYDGTPLCRGRNPRDLLRPASKLGISHDSDLIGYTKCFQILLEGEHACREIGEKRLMPIQLVRMRIVATRETMKILVFRPAQSIAP